ncbi:MAG: hypothetical protein QM756_28420 [Polyangiaceae bacterium]
MRLLNRVRQGTGRSAWALLGLASAWSCGHDFNTASDRGVGSDNGATASGGGSNIGLGASSGGSSSSAGAPTLPPEQEKESSFKLPVQSGRWVWAANPQSGHVSVIDTRGLSVQVERAGFGPTYLAALGTGGDVESAAIVLNVLGNTASVMRLRNGAIDVKHVPTHVGANSWAVSASGNWAIAWGDANAVTSPDAADSFQDITLVDVSGDTPHATRLSVGYRPSRIFFDQAEARAFVVSQASVSVIELSHQAPGVLRDVTLGLGREKAVDVAVVPDGRYALFRVEGSERVSIVELESDERTEVALSGPVTDLDLVADGTSAIAVVRGRPVVSMGAGGASAEGGSGAGESAATGNAGAAGHTEAAGAAGSQADGSGGVSGENTEAGAGAGGVAGANGRATPPASGFTPSEVFVLDVAALRAGKAGYRSALVDDLVGSVAVSSDGAEAVLYTSVVDLPRVSVVATDPKSDSFLVPRSVAVHAPVSAVFIAPDHAHALVTLRAAAGSSGVGFGIVPLLEALPAQVRATSVPITAAAFAPAPTTSAILTSASGTTAFLVRMPELRVDPVALLNLPLAAGIVAEEGVGYVVQQHPDGQLSLVDLSSGELRTLTGFELSKGVSDAP